MNMAEVGHSKMRMHHDLQLIDAAHTDASTMMTHEAENIGIFRGLGLSTGRGPNLNQHKR